MSNKSKDAGDSHTRRLRPPQHQDHQPGLETLMRPRPRPVDRSRQGSDRLLGRCALITGGDSGIGRAVAAAFAREGADVVVSYLDEDEDARDTLELVEGFGRSCELVRGDIRSESFCRRIIESAVDRFGRLDVLVNNAAVQFPEQSVADISRENLYRTFETNVFSMFYLCAAALEHLKRSRGASIINTTSVTAYRGSDTLLDYAATKGAIVAFTRSLSQQLVSDRVRVNAVAPGPIWTPLIPASFEPDKVAEFGSDVPMGRAGEPSEVAGAYVFLASDDASYITGQVLHVNGGEIVNG
jgi:NAD(P)-dependent dehydrogenase (short-subunit alcohol dehydrogenase family)